jgi:hypothetical protein
MPVLATRPLHYQYHCSTFRGTIARGEDALPGGVNSSDQRGFAGEKSIRTFSLNKNRNDSVVLYHSPSYEFNIKAGGAPRGDKPEPYSEEIPL